MALVMEGDVARTWIEKMSDYQTIPTTRMVQAIQVPYDFDVVQDTDTPITGTLHCKAGCWLVMSPQGALYAVPDEAFRKWYEEVVTYESIEGVRRV